jgi:hypothetical protein
MIILCDNYRGYFMWQLSWLFYVTTTVIILCDNYRDYFMWQLP